MTLLQQTARRLTVEVHYAEMLLLGPKFEEGLEEVEVERMRAQAPVAKVVIMVVVEEVVVGARVPAVLGNKESS